MGFVEVQPLPEQPQPVSSPVQPSSKSRSLSVPDIREADSRADGRADGPTRRCRDVQITVELVPTVGRAKRRSRLWVREKKGKRWVEDDYTQILHQLRRL